MGGQDSPAIKPYNRVPYPGDVDGDVSKESMVIESLENGKVYYAWVRTVGVKGTESRPSNEVRFVPLAKGIFILSQNHLAGNGGFSFDSEVSTVARDPRCDIYLYATSSRVGLSSPNRLSAGLRESKFYKGKVDRSSGANTIAIRSGDRIIVLTASGRAELDIVRIDGAPPEVSAKIRYIFYPNESVVD